MTQPPNEPGRRRPLPVDVAASATQAAPRSHVAPEQPLHVKGIERASCKPATPACDATWFSGQGDPAATASLKQVRDTIREEMEAGSCHLHLPPPNDTVAEAWILLSVLCGMTHPDELVGLEMVDFYHNDYGTLYAYLQVIARRWPPSGTRPISDADVLDAVGRSGLETIGCERLLEDLRTTPRPVFGSSEAAARKVRRLAAYRRVLRAMLEAEAELRSAGEPWNGGGMYEGMVGRPEPNTVKANVTALLAAAQKLMADVEDLQHVGMCAR